MRKNAESARRIRLFGEITQKTSTEERFMSKTILARLVALLLAMIVVIGGIVPAAAAKTESTSSGTELQQTTLNTISYSTYRSKHPDAKKASAAIVIKAADYDKSATTAEAEVLSEYAGRTGKLLYTGAEGAVSWKVNVPETGLYAFKIEYSSVSDKTNTVERSLYLNGKVPFAEARFLQMFKTWVNDYDDETGRFASDKTGNELRPNTTVKVKWSTYTLMDSNGYISSPLELYLEKGENVIALEAVREEAVLDTLTLFPLETLPSYESVKAGYEKNGYKSAEGAEPIVLQAEMPSAVSNYTIYPTYDRSSALTEPQNATKIKLNTIGGDKWKTAGTWIEYEFTCAKTGLYNIVTRFKQNGLDGLYVSRRLYINGAVPFEEANLCQFPYGDAWQVDSLTYHYGADEKDKYDFEFYFEAGKTYTLRFEVTVGYLGEIIDTISKSLDSLDKDYLEILKLTGADPDENRSYGFARVMPDTIRDLYTQSEVLAEVIEYLTGMSGVKGENITTLEQTQLLLKQMGSDEDKIAGNLSTLKTYIGSLGTWINNVNAQPVQLDYLVIQPTGSDLPRAEANFFESFIYQIKQFFGSFISDYNSLGETGDGESAEEASNIEVWFTTGRDQAQIVRNLVDNSYRKEHPNASVNLKLVASGTLLPSVLAKCGPDVALNGAGGDTINYAIRNAVLALNEFDSFDEVITRFSPSAIESQSLYGKTYGLPDTQSFPIMFYRKDILEDLGLEIPKTWDDLLAMIPVLQYNNMTIGLRKEDYQTYLYQMGGDMWADDGMRINLDSNKALEAFEMSCNMFTQYSLNVSYDFANQFRTGEMPIGIADYTIYNTLIAFATEIAGLWGFAPIPGIEQPDGTINNVAVSAAVGINMMSGCNDKEASWDFMDWYTDKYFQVNYSNELVAILGDCAKNPTANMSALEELDWTADEYKNLYEQFGHLVAVTPYPGNYIITRYTDFAFFDAYNNLMDPVEQLLANISAINKEITRKRTEFKLETLAAGQTLAQKRMGQAADAIAELEKKTDKYADAVKKATEAIEAKDIKLLAEAGKLFDKANTAKVEIDVSKQTLASDYGGYDISSLNENELVAFISSCLTEASSRLKSYMN